MTERIDEFNRLAAAALECYALTPSLKFIGHSDNVTYQVTDTPSGDKFLLRLHEPIAGHHLDIRQEPQAIRSELVWLEALCRDTGITVPEPVHNREGELVTPVSLDDGGVVQCTLLRWIEGEHIRLDAPDAEESVRRLGVLLARLHDHASHWPIPPGFQRPDYGLSFFNQVIEQIETGVQSGVVRRGDFDCIRATIGRAGRMATGLKPNQSHWGLIHNDLHPGNCLVHEGNIYPIDFSLCGFGYYVYDIGTSMGSLPTQFRRAFLDGYTGLRELPEDWERIVEGMLLVSRMSYYGLVLADPSHTDWLRRRIPDVVDTLCSRFLRDQRFLFEVR